MRLIDADAVMCKANDSFKSAGLHEEDFRKFKRWINKSPTIDAESVVRCRECKHYKSYESIFGKEWFCWRDDVKRNDDDFCSYGEREGE